MKLSIFTVPDYSGMSVSKTQATQEDKKKRKF